MNDALRYLLLTALLPPLFLAPGFLWLRRAGASGVIALYAGPGATAAAGAAIVALGVLLPVDVPTACVAGLALVVASGAWCGWTGPRPLLPERADLAGVGAWVLAFFALAAFHGIPSHPYGNWGPRTVGPERLDTPRWPGSPRDNTFPYRTGQLALHEKGGAELKDRFAPQWWISDRTPLTGLDFAWVAGALDVAVRTDDPTLRPTREAPMRTVDEWGFWAYDLVAMLFNVATVLGAFLLARVWLGARVASAAALAGALMPGVFLNALYTWPKQAIAYFALVAFALAWRGRPAAAGAFIGLGYLAHPAALWWLPAAVAIALATPEARRRWRPITLRLAGAALLVALPWTIFTAFVVKASSRLTTWPLGYRLEDPTDVRGGVAKAFDVFTERGLPFNAWIRLHSLAGSALPVDLSRTPGGEPGSGQYVGAVGLLWTNAHGFSVWGIVGLVLFPAVLATVVRRWPADRRLILWVVVPTVALVALLNGYAYPFATQSMLPLVGLLAVAAGVLLTTAPRWVRLALVAAMAVELGTVAYASLLSPFAISTAPLVLFLAIAIGAHLALLVWLLAATGLVDPPRRAVVEGDAPPAPRVARRSHCRSDGPRDA